MMASQNIKQLLNKKEWTGDEVGKAVILSLINDYEQSLQGKDKPKRLFSYDKLQKMIRTLANSTHMKRYKRYVGLHNWLMQYQAVAIAYYQQVDGEINRYLGTVTTAYAVEKEYKYIEKLPTIMTQKQYDEVRAKRIEEQLTGKNGYGDIGYSIFRLVDLAINHFVIQLQNNPKKVNPLKPIKKKYQKAPVKSFRILLRYNRVMGEGYYTLEDGRRSDQMTDAEWQEALSTPAMKESSKEMERAEELGEELSMRSAPNIAITRELERSRLVMQGSTEEEADKVQEEADIQRGWRVPCQWHYYDEAPTDITKWDIIETGDLFEYYPAIIGEDNETDSYTEQVEDFKDEFPELFETIISEIDNTFFKGEDGISKLPLKEWKDTTFSSMELYNKNFFDFRGIIESDSSIFEGNPRALMNGIAILRASDIKKNRLKIDERGYYNEPDIINNISIKCGLEQFTPLNKDYISNALRFEEGRNIIEDGYYYLLGYDTAISLIADHIGIPEFNLFKMGYESIASRIKALNGLTDLLYSRTKDTHYHNEESKQTKLQVLLDYFQPLKWDEFTIPKKAIEQAKALLNDNMKAFEAQDGIFINILAKRNRED